MLAVLAMLACVALATAGDDPAHVARRPGGESAMDDSELDDASELVREGVEIVDVVGHFRLQGDRLAFHANQGASAMIALENLALERIAHQVNETPKLLEWSVSGQLTEYRGANYLLITRAHLRPSQRHDLPEL